MRPPKEVELIRNSDLCSRIMGPSMLRRWKSEETVLPGLRRQVSRTPKIRLVALGHQDPDLCRLVEEQQLSSPPISTSTLQAGFQAIASSRLPLVFEDISSGFLQPGKPQRSAGRLFMEVPPGGLPGVEEGSLIEILVHFMDSTMLHAPGGAFPPPPPLDRTGRLILKIHASSLFERGLDNFQWAYSCCTSTTCAWLNEDRCSRSAQRRWGRGSKSASRRSGESSSGPRWSRV